MQFYDHGFYGLGMTLRLRVRVDNRFTCYNYYTTLKSDCTSCDCMRVSLYVSSVCLCVCFSVCVSVCCS